MIKKEYFFVLILLGVWITGCRDLDDFGEEWKTDGKTVEITIPTKVPAITVQGRAGTTTEEEKQLKHVDVLVFKVETVEGVETESFAYRVDNPTVVTEEEAGKEEVSIKAKLNLSEAGEEYRLVFIGNLRTELDEFLNAINDPVGVSKNDLLKGLTFSQVGKWDIGTDALPMWAEASQVTEITKELHVSAFGEINFIRSVARIELSVASGIEEKFEIKEVTVHKAPVNGRAVPDPVNMEGGEATAPSLTTGGKIGADKMVFPITNNELTGVYINEANNHDDNEAVFLIVKAIYTGDGYSDNTDATFYKVRFYGNDGTPKDILRNFTYNMVVTAVDSPGEEDEDKAIGSNSTNLTVTMTDWSNGDMKLVVFDKQHYLAVSESRMEVSKNEFTYSFLVKTNYEGGWSATVSQGGDWLGGLDPVSSPNVETLETLTFNVSENNGQERTGIISITCGNDLTLDVYVIQTVDEGVSLKIWVKDESTNEYVELEDYTLLFHSGNHYAITPKELKVTWTPASENLIVDYDRTFDWGADNDLHTIYEEDGIAYMKIVPARMITRPVVEADPLESWFPSEETAIKIQVGGHSSSKQTVSVKKQHYEVYLDRAERYKMDGQTYTIMLYSNSPEWEVLFTNKGDISEYIKIETQNPPRGGDNVENGTFKIVDDEVIIEGAGEEIKFTLLQPASGSINTEVHAKITYKDLGEDIVKDYVFRAYYEDDRSEFIAGGDANCYMLEPNGKKIHIPVSQANRSTMLGEQIKNGDQLTATFIWTDHPGGLGKESEKQEYAVYDMEIIGTGPTAILEVTPGNAEGNAVIGIKKGDDILWSWHLWVSEFDPNNEENDRYTFRNYQFLDRNLGALDDDPKKPQSFGLYYQWGRKDPFPSAIASKSTEFIPIYNELGGKIEMTKINRTSLGQSEWSNGVHFLEHATRNPLQFIMSTDWWCTGSLGNYLQEASKFWSENETGDIANAKKGVFDPCPDGWKTVPASTSNASEWYKLFAECQYYSDGHYVEVHNKEAGLVNLGQWPFVGVIGCNDGAISGVETGRYWTGNKDAWGNTAIHSRFTNSSKIAHPSEAYQSSNGLPVRCMRRLGDTR